MNDKGWSWKLALDLGLNPAYLTRLCLTYFCVMCSQSIRLEGMIGNGPAVCEFGEFAAGERRGMGDSSGKLCQRQSLAAGPRRWLLRLLAELALYTGIFGGIRFGKPPLIVNMEMTSFRSVHICFNIANMETFKIVFAFLSIFNSSTHFIMSTKLRIFGIEIFHQSPILVHNQPDQLHSNNKWEIDSTSFSQKGQREREQNIWTKSTLSLYKKFAYWNQKINFLKGEVEETLSYKVELREQLNVHISLKNTMIVHRKQCMGIIEGDCCFYRSFKGRAKCVKRKLKKEKSGKESGDLGEIQEQELGSKELKDLKQKHGRFKHLECCTKNHHIVASMAMYACPCTSQCSTQVLDLPKPPKLVPRHASCHKSTQMTSSTETPSLHASNDLQKYLQSSCKIANNTKSCPDYKSLARGPRGVYWDGTSLREIELLMERSIKVTKSGTATVCKIMPSPFLYQWKYLQLRGEMGGKH
ncbi:hypothetical protein LXL04_011283 [Taraxacum kok-saghyz]